MRSDLTLPSGTTYATAIHQLVQKHRPGVVVKVDPVAHRYTTPSLMYGHYTGDIDWWVEAEQLAVAVGLRLRRRGETVTAYIPWRDRAEARWRKLTAPARRAWQRLRDRLFQPGDRDSSWWDFDFDFDPDWD